MLSIIGHAVVRADKEEAMVGRRWAVWLSCCLTLIVTGRVSAEPYELSKTDVMDPKIFKSSDIALFGVKLGDPESKAYDVLVNEKIPGVKTEQERHLFCSSINESRPVRWPACG